ncbi:MAG: hypothetical protein J7K87_03895 [Candidatus Aenigmarchaeota archaeon]|nr:hypothetical protein [Candidatus Aenigmarchaeota archaeon]
MIDEINRQIISEIFDAIADEVSDKSSQFNSGAEQVGYIISRWTDYFNFYFDRVCLHCGKVLTKDTLRSYLSQRSMTMQWNLIANRRDKK